MSTVSRHIAETPKEFYRRWRRDACIAARKAKMVATSSTSSAWNVVDVAGF